MNINNNNNVNVNYNIEESGDHRAPESKQGELVLSSGTSKQVSPTTSSTSYTQDQIAGVEKVFNEFIDEIKSAEIKKSLDENNNQPNFMTSLYNKGMSYFSGRKDVDQATVSPATSNHVEPPANSLISFTGDNLGTRTVFNVLADLMSVLNQIKHEENEEVRGSAIKTLVQSSFLKTDGRNYLGYDGKFITPDEMKQIDGGIKELSKISPSTQWTDTVKTLIVLMVKHNMMPLDQMTQAEYHQNVILNKGGVFDENNPLRESRVASYEPLKVTPFIIRAENGKYYLTEKRNHYQKGSELTFQDVVSLHREKKPENRSSPVIDKPVSEKQVENKSEPFSSENIQSSSYLEGFRNMIWSSPTGESEGEEELSTINEQELLYSQELKEVGVKQNSNNNSVSHDNEDEKEDKSLEEAKEALKEVESEYQSESPPEGEQFKTYWETDTINKTKK